MQKTPIPGMGQWNNRAQLTTIRLRTPDADDSQIWLQSSISETHRLPRGAKEEFSFNDASLQIITNTGGGVATLDIECLACAESGVFIGSNRRAGATMRAGERLRNIRMRPGEAITLRSLDAIEPNSRGADGRAVKLRPGQGVVV